MGDAVMSLAFIRAAQPHYEVHVCCSPAAEPIFLMVLPRSQVHRWQPPWATGQGPRFSPRAAFDALRAAVAMLAPLRASLAICAWCDPRIGVLMNWLKVPSRIGFACHRDNFYGRHLAWRQRQLTIARGLEVLARVALRRPMYTQALQRRDYAQHHVEDWRQIAETLGLEFDAARSGLESDRGEHRSEGVTIAHDPPEVAVVPTPARRPRIAIHPGASEVQKRWPLAHFLRLATALAERFEVCFIEPPEVPLADTETAGFAVLRTRSLAQLAERLRDIDALICNDSGVGHLAAATGMPVIAIFLSSDDGHFSPYTSRERVISFDGACDMRPCFGPCVKHTLLCHQPADYESIASRVTTGLARLFG